MLDASALLAFTHREERAGEVGPFLGNSVISSVNWAEVLQRVVSAGLEVRGKREDMESLGLQIHAFTAEDAESTGFQDLANRFYGEALEKNPNHVKAKAALSFEPG